MRQNVKNTYITVYCKSLYINHKYRYAQMFHGIFAAKRAAILYLRSMFLEVYLHSFACFCAFSHNIRIYMRVRACVYF